MHVHLFRCHFFFAVQQYFCDPCEMNVLVAFRDALHSGHAWAYPPSSLAFLPPLQDLFAYRVPKDRQAGVTTPNARPLPALTVVTV